MKPDNTVATYSFTVRIIHWGMAVLLLSLLLAGLTMVRSLEPWQPALLGLHKSLGTIAFIAVITRLSARLDSASPGLPQAMHPLQRAAARSSHLLLYVLMIALPLSGYLMQSAAGRPIHVFDWLTIPTAFPVNLELYGLFRETHFALAASLAVLVLIHIGAALHHGLVRRDGVLQSITLPKGKLDKA
ncbi:cytochrome b [Microbulbifer sp. M83]|uniref:cytochrome b n=1 Tax=Microbulbifer sp. M83 TaxID=3118246 RepID=UPI002FE33F49